MAPAMMLSGYRSCRRRFRELQYLGGRPEQEVAEALLLPGLDHEGHQVGPGDAAGAAAVEAAHQPRHGCSVGEVQPRSAQRVHHRVAVLGLTMPCTPHRHE